MLQNDEQRHRGNGGLAQGQDDPGQCGPVARAVDKGGFGNGLRQSLHEVHHQDDVVGAHGAGKDHGPEGIQKARVSDHQIGGDHAAVEKHGAHEVPHEIFALGKRTLPQGHGIRGQHRHQHGNGPAHDGAEERDQIGAEKLRVAHYDLIVFQIEINGPERDLVGDHRVDAAEGHRQNV